MNRKKLSEAYDRAKAAQNDPQLFDKIQEQQNEQERNRTTSAAKEIQPDGLEGTSLGHVQNLKTSFEQAKTQRAVNDHQKPDQAKPRTVSAAKEYQPEGLKGTSLDRAQNLKTSFDKAKTRSVANDHQRPDQAQHRPISAAKEYQPDALKGTSLDQTDNVKPAFDQARQGSPANDQHKPEPQPQKGSTMVKESQPKPLHVPKGEMRRGPDKESFDGRWLEEQKKAQTGLQAAQEKAAAIKAMRDRQGQREQSHGPERD